MPWVDISISFIKVVLLLLVVLTLVAYLTFAERRVSAFMQDRLGPNRVGPFGLLQPLADGLKFIFKEDIIPERAYKPLYILAPAVALITSIVALAVIPIGEGFNTTIFGLLKEPTYVKLQIADINVGLIYVFAIGSLSVYGVVLGGWASNSKYPLLGSLRSAAQMVSYEIPLVLSILGVIILAGSFKLSEIVHAQSKLWYVVPQALGFLVFLVAAFAETNRLPFDMPEAEPEIVAGYHTEYSSMKFAMFFMAEYTHMIVVSCLLVCLFLGGWYPLPFGGWWGIDIQRYWYLPPLVFIGKVLFFLFVFIWVRWTIPRFRYDQVMGLGWKVLFPLAVLNIIGTSAVVVFLM